MPSIQLNNGRSFQAASSVTILDAAQQAGYTLEHSCRTGRCGACRTQVLSGQAQALCNEEGLSDEDRAQGWILSCARSAQTDLVLDIEDLGPLAAARSKTLPCRIQSIERVGSDVMKVGLRLPPQAQWDYLSGQYVNVIIPGGARRSYSLASSPAEFRTRGVLVLYIRKVDGGTLSTYWFEQAKLNDLLRIDGPLGTFYRRSVADLDLVFLATGTGIAPILAMLSELPTLPPEEQPRSVHLLWGARTEADLLMVAPAVASRYTPVLSRPSAGWAGARGHVQDVLLASSPDLTQAVVYACGSPAMIQSARRELLAAGLPAKRWHADAFVASDATTPQP